MAEIESEDERIRQGQQEKDILEDCTIDSNEDGLIADTIRNKMEPINKTALVAKIEKCYNNCLKRAEIIGSDYWNAKADAYRNVLTILDNTLEVKEVNLNEEIESYFKGFGKFPSVGIDDCIDIAKHFFEFGIKVVQKGE